MGDSAVQKTSSTILHSFSALITSLLSCSTCPGCITIYTSLLSFLGVELIGLHIYFLPLMALSTCATILLMGREVFLKKAKSFPLLLATLSAIIMIYSAIKEQEFLLYSALPFFIGSVFLNKFLIWKKSKNLNCCGKKHHHK